jgi:hypothetical protein
LVGKENEVNLIITPTNPLDPNRKNYSIKGAVKKYESTDFTGPDQGEVIFPFHFENTLAVSFKFENDYFDYKNVLIENRPIKDKATIKNYAHKLIDILRTGNVENILNEFKPKLTDYAAAYFVSPEFMFNEFIRFLNEKYFVNSPRLKFAEDEISLRPWCDEKIWEIGVGFEMEELLLTAPSDEGLEYATKVYVGFSGRDLKVVR